MNKICKGCQNWKHFKKECWWYWDSKRNCEHKIPSKYSELEESMINEDSNDFENDEEDEE